MRPYVLRAAKALLNTDRFVYNSHPLLLKTKFWVESVHQVEKNGSRDNAIGLWDVSTGTLKHIFTGYQDDVYSVSFSPDG